MSKPHDPMYSALQAHSRTERRRQSIRALVVFAVLVGIAVALYYWGQSINNR